MSRFLDKRKAQKRATKQLTDSNVLGDLALWYGRGKVVFRGTLKLYNDDGGEDKYTVVLLQPTRDVNYLLGGFVSVPNEQNKYPNRRPDKRNFVPEERIGSVYLYEGKTEGYYAIIYLDSGNSYIGNLDEYDGDNTARPVMSGKLRYLNPKEPAKDKYKQTVNRKKVQGTEGRQKNKYFDRVVESDFNKSRSDVILEMVSELSTSEVKHLVDQILSQCDSRSDCNSEEEADYEVVDTAEKLEPEELPWDDVEEEPVVKVPSKKSRISEVVAPIKPSIKVKALTDRMYNLGSDLVDNIDDEEII